MQVGVAYEQHPVEPAEVVVLGIGLVVALLADAEGKAGIAFEEVAPVSPEAAVPFLPVLKIEVRCPEGERLAEQDL